MTAFLKKYRHELQNPVFINLESLGCGNLYYVEKEGMFPSRKADTHLLNLAGRAAREQNLPFQKGSFRTILTDNVAVLARNLPGITIMGCGPRELIPHWHQDSDRFENVDEGNLQYAVELVAGMIKLLDNEQSDSMH